MYETSTALPNIFGRAEIIKSTSKEYTPIQNHCRQLRLRFIKTKEALETQNIGNLQMLLKGTVSPEVNSGPQRLIEVFLSSGENTKDTEKLKRAIVMLIQQANVALHVNSEYCIDNPAYLPLHEQLESGYESLKNAILPYIRR